MFRQLHDTLQFCSLLVFLEGFAIRASNSACKDPNHCFILFCFFCTGSAATFVSDGNKIVLDSREGQRAKSKEKVMRRGISKGLKSSLPSYPASVSELVEFNMWILKWILKWSNFLFKDTVLQNFFFRALEKIWSFFTISQFE